MKTWNRLRTLMLAVAAAVAIAAPACGKDKGGGAKGGGKPTGAAATALDVLPADSSLIVGLNVKKLTVSKLWLQFSGSLMEREDVKQVFGEMKTACDLDPARDVEQFVVAAPSLMDQDKLVLLVKGKFDEAKIEKCLKAVVARKEPAEPVEVKKEGKVTIYTSGDDALYVAWVASDTLLIGEKEVLTNILESKSKARDNKALAEMMAKVNTDDTLWMAMAVPDSGEFHDNMRQIGQGTAPKGVWMSLAYMKDLSVNAGLRFAKAEDAKKLATSYQAQFDQVKKMPQMGDYLKNASIKNSGNDVVFTAKLSEKQIDSLLAQLSMMLPMMLGGM